MINKFWTYISNAGISRSTPPAEAKQFMLTNQFIVLTIIITSLYTFFFEYFGYYKAVAAETFFIISYLILWFASKVNQTKLARFLFIIIVNFQLYIACLIFGQDSQIYIVFGPVVATPLVLYGFKHKNIMFLFVILTVILVFDLFKINFSSVLSTTLSSEAIRYFKFSSNLLAIICELILVYALVISSNEVEQILGKSNILLENQFETIFNNSSDALFLVDQESKFILKANNRAVELFGMKNESDFFSHKGLDFYKEKPSKQVLDKINKDLFLKGFYENEFIYKSEKGNEFWGAYAVRLLNISEKKFLTVRITDISENRKNQEIIKSSLEEKKVLLAEIHHRVKNNLAIISGLLNLQASHIEDEKLKGLFEESRNRIHSMALIHEKLYQNETFAIIQLDSYIEDLLHNIKRSYNASSTQINFSVLSNDIVLDIKHAVPCGLILNELISNSFKHAFINRKKGEVKIEFTKVGNTFKMMVSDDGIGYEAEALLKKSDTLGLTLINALTTQLDGTLTTTNKNGTTYYLSFDV